MVCVYVKQRGESKYTGETKALTFGYKSGKKKVAYLNVDILFLEYEGANFICVHVEDGS